MKKILTAVVLGSLLTMIVLPMVASAQFEGPAECCKIHRNIKVGGVSYKKDDIVGAPDGYCPIGNIDVATTEWGTVCLVNTITYATDWVFYILTTIVVIMIIAGGFIYLTAAGDPEKAGKGKSFIVYALIGLAIALFARVIPAIVAAMF